MVELKWDDKYDKKGGRIGPLRVKLPFQTIETVNASAQQRQMMLNLSGSKHSEWHNRLIWGDKKYVLPSLIDEFAGKVDLIYIDPPFNLGADFSFTASVPDVPETEIDESETFLKRPSVIEQKAYRDTWSNGADSYVPWLNDTLVYLFELLSDTGSIYVHLDNNMAHYAKVLLDDIFGRDRFVNQIIWQKVRVSKSQTVGFGNIHDIIFFYTKSEKFVFNEKHIEYATSYKDSHYNLIEENTDRRYGLWDFTQSGPGPSRSFLGSLIEPPPGKHWIWSQERIDKGLEEGRITFTSKGTPRLKRYLDEAKGIRLGDIWSDILDINSMANERLGYPTQKPEALLERIITSSSVEGNLILDCFTGSGTTPAVAEKLNRRWIACDLGRFSIHTTRKRLLDIQGLKPFIVQNLGKYERQTWQVAEFGGKKNAENLQREYRKFILQLYSARPIDGYAWLHGIKDGRMVHVGSVDSPIAPNDITQIAIEFKKAVGTGKDAPQLAAIDILGWDFAFEINEIGIQQAKAAGINLRCLRIPRDVMDPKAVEQGDVKFFELAALSVDSITKKNEVSLELTDFTIPPDDVPQEVQKAITHWSQWIDYWAIDWDNKGDTFHNQWQTYRTKQEKSLKLKTTHNYEQPGEYTVLVKVIDILGNDTTKAIKVMVK
jgi:DNA modification methylase